MRVRTNAQLPTLLWTADFCESGVCAIGATEDGLTWVSTTRRRRLARKRLQFTIDTNVAVGVTRAHEAPARLIALDSSGRFVRAHRGLCLVAILADGALLVADRTALLRLEPAGKSVGTRRESPALNFVGVRGRAIVLQEARRMVMLDEHLRPVNEFPCPCEKWYRISEDGMYWVEDRWIHRCDWSGRTQHVAGIPLHDVALEIARTCPDLTWHGNDGPRPITSFGDAFPASWVVSADADEQFLFVCNHLPPFAVVCVERDGTPRWCRCLSRGCCGYRVQRLHCGRFVASSGCGGTVSWIDANGNLLAQSARKPEVGFAGVIDSDLQIGFDDSVCVSRADHTVLSFRSDGELQWEIQPVPREMAYCDPFRSRLICASQARGRFGRRRAQVAAYSLANARSTNAGS